MENINTQVCRNKGKNNIAFPGLNVNPVQLTLGSVVWTQLHRANSIAPHSKYSDPRSIDHDLTKQRTEMLGPQLTLEPYWRKSNQKVGGLGF